MNRNMLHFLKVVLGIAFITLGNAAPEDSPVVTTKQGKLQGTREAAANGRFFYAFKGIPYAAPPVGDLRFKDPRPPASSRGLIVSNTPDPCPQPVLALYFGAKPGVAGNEDCLYLNVFTPKPSEADLPVMVFIHGGGFMFGDAQSFGGHPKLLLQKDVVLVSIQYRLGTLGFMSTGDSVLPGNLGLKDQNFALKWVQENIHLFGGNPKRITLFGQSAGSASTHSHIVSPYSRGLFQQAILEGASGVTPYIVRDDHRKIMLEGAKVLGCPGADHSSPDSSQIFECLKQKSVKDLVMMSMPADIEICFPFYMSPRIDGDFLPAHPAQLLKEGKYQKVNLMAGVCQNEGATWLGPMLHNKTAAERLSKDLGQLAKIFIGMEMEDNFEYLLKRGFYHYVGEVGIDENKAEEIEKFIAHYIITLSVDFAASLHARDLLFGKSTYRYELQHRATSSFMSHIGYHSEVTDKWVAHIDEQQYIFNGVEGLGDLTRPDDIFLSDIMVALWTNFARTGNPTPDGKLGFKWEPMSSENDMRYLSLTPAPVMKEDNRHEDREFWKNMPIRISKILFPDKFAPQMDSC